MSEEFAGHPKSVGEVRAERDGDCSKWTPREMLLAMLRDIDEGADIDAMIICYRQTVDGVQRGRFQQAAQDGLVTLGLLSATAINLVRD